jgi:hypothetical protein
MQWLTFTTWKLATNPIHLPGGTWQYQLSAIDNDNNRFTITSYIEGEVLRKIIIGAIALVLAIVFYSIMKKWPLRKK